MASFARLTCIFTRLSCLGLIIAWGSIIQAMELEKIQQIDQVWDLQDDVGETEIILTKSENSNDISVQHEKAVEKATETYRQKIERGCKACCNVFCTVAPPIVITVGGIVTPICPVAGVVLGVIGGLLSKLAVAYKNKQNSPLAGFVKLAGGNKVIESYPPPYWEHLEALWNGAQSKRFGLAIKREDRVPLFNRGSKNKRELNPTAQAILNTIIADGTTSKRITHKVQLNEEKRVRILSLSEILNRGSYVSALGNTVMVDMVSL